MRAFGPIARAESCRSAKGLASGFACASLRFTSGVDARTGVDAAGSVFATTLATVGGLAFSKRSRSTCVAFGWCSWTASTRAAKITVPKTPVASQTVSRLNLLIVSLVTYPLLSSLCLRSYQMDSELAMHLNVERDMSKKAHPRTHSPINILGCFALFNVVRSERLQNSRRSVEVKQSSRVGFCSNPELFNVILALTFVRPIASGWDTFLPLDRIPVQDGC